MRSLFHYYTQITPLENGGHAVWMDYKQKVPKFARNHRGNGFYEVLLPLLPTKYPLGNRGPYSLNELQAKKIKIFTKQLRQWVLWGPFSIIIHKSPPWKTGATQFEWITSNQLQSLHETTKPMGFMRLLFHYYTQITPLKNGGHTVFIKLQAKNSETCTKPQRQLVLWGPISIISIITHISQITPLENGGQIVWMDYKHKKQKFARNHWGIGFYKVPFPLIHTTSKWLWRCEVGEKVLMYRKGGLCTIQNNMVPVGRLPGKRW